jgi:hypothetical protein
VRVGDAFSYAKREISTPPKQMNSGRGVEKRNDKTEGREPLSDVFQPVGIS